MLGELLSLSHGFLQCFSHFRDFGFFDRLTAAGGMRHFFGNA
jgi:hypothetical protein